MREYHRKFPDNMPYEPADPEEIINAQVLPLTPPVWQTSLFCQPVQQAHLHSFRRWPWTSQARR